MDLARSLSAEGAVRNANAVDAACIAAAIEAEEREGGGERKEEAGEMDLGGGAYNGDGGGVELDGGWAGRRGRWFVGPTSDVSVEEKFFAGCSVR